MSDDVFSSVDGDLVLVGMGTWHEDIMCYLRDAGVDMSACRLVLEYSGSNGDLANGEWQLYRLVASGSFSEGS